MSKIAKNLKQLKTNVITRQNEILKKDIAPIVEDRLKQHILDDVYNVYTPVKYIRRYTNNGLIDDNNIQYNIYNKTQILYVYDVAQPQGPIIPESGPFFGKTPLQNIIEHGAYNLWGWDNQGNYHSGGAWTSPRRFVRNTQKDINKNYDEINDAIKKGFGC